MKLAYVMLTTSTDSIKEHIVGQNSKNSHHVVV